MKDAKTYFLVRISKEANTDGALLKQGNKPRHRKLWNRKNRKHRRKVKGIPRGILKGDENQAWNPTNQSRASQ